MKSSPSTPDPIPAEPFARVSSLPPPPPFAAPETLALSDAPHANLEEQAPSERRIGSDSSIRPHVLSAPLEELANDVAPAPIAIGARKARMRVIVGGVVGSAALLMMLAIGMHFIGSSASVASSPATLPAAPVEAPPVSETSPVPAPLPADPAPTASASAATPVAAPRPATRPVTTTAGPSIPKPPRGGSPLIRKAPF